MIGWMLALTSPVCFWLISFFPPRLTARLMGESIPRKKLCSEFCVIASWTTSRSSRVEEKRKKKKNSLIVSEDVWAGSTMIQHAQFERSELVHRDGFSSVLAAAALCALNYKRC